MRRNADFRGIVFLLNSLFFNKVIVILNPALLLIDPLHPKNVESGSPNYFFNIKLLGNN